MFRWFAALVVVLAPAVAAAQVSDKIAFQFGGQTLLLERELFSGLSHRRVTKEDQAKQNLFVLKVVEVLGVHPIPVIENCRGDYRTILLKNRQMIVQPSDTTKDRPREVVNDTLYRRTWLSSEHYEFRADDLRDAYGRKIGFGIVEYENSRRIRLSYFVAPEIFLDTTFLPSDCFMKYSDTIVRQMNEFFRSRIKQNTPQ
jgi:hypothetical protein